MIVIGLTGSIGMGKTTVGAMFSSLYIPVHESDEAVHDLLQPGAKGYEQVVQAFPYSKHQEIYGQKNRRGLRELKRSALGELVFNDQKKRETLEGILHPLVREAQDAFIRKYTTVGTKMVMLDIPLLFETGAETRVDYTVVCSAPFPVQRARVLSRPGMNEKKFQAILERQMPDGEKCARADFVIHTGLSRAETMKEVKSVIEQIRKGKTKTL